MALRPFARSNPQMFQISVPQDRQARSPLDPLSDHQPMQIVHARHGLVVEPDDHVSRTNSALRSGRICQHLVNSNPGSLRQLVPAGQRLINCRILAGDAEVTASNASLLDQPARHELGSLASDRKTDALRGGDDRGVPDNLAAAINSGPPEFPGFSAASV